MLEKFLPYIPCKREEVKAMLSSAKVCSSPRSCPTTLSCPSLEHLLNGMLWSQLMVEDNCSGWLSLAVVFLETLRRCQRGPAEADGLSPLLAIHLPLLLAAAHSSMRSLNILWLSYACSWQRPGDPWRVVFLKKMLRNIVSSNLNTSFH